jgi:hypothetical protein
VNAPPAARTDGLERFVRLAHELCDKWDSRDWAGCCQLVRLLADARRAARAEQAALDRAFDLPRRNAE